MGIFSSICQRQDFSKIRWSKHSIFIEPVLIPSISSSSSIWTSTFGLGWRVNTSTRLDLRKSPIIRSSFEELKLKVSYLFIWELFVMILPRWTINGWESRLDSNGDPSNDGSSSGDLSKLKSFLILATEREEERVGDRDDARSFHDLRDDDQNKSTKAGRLR